MLRSSSAPAHRHILPEDALAGRGPAIWAVRDQKLEAAANGAGRTIRNSRILKPHPSFDRWSKHHRITLSQCIEPSPTSHISAEPLQEKQREQPNGKGVYIEYRVPEKGGRPFCWGTRKWVHGQMFITAKRSQTADGPAVTVEYPEPLTYDQTTTIPVAVAVPDGRRIGKWTIDVRLRYPDGVERAIPVKAGDGPLTGAEPQGGSFSWDPNSRKLTIGTPKMACAAGA